MLTAAVRDIRRAAPSRFRISVETSCPDLWLHNPNLAPILDQPPQVISCHYPLIRRSNRIPAHFVAGFHEYLSERMGIRIEPTEFKGDVHISGGERRSISKAEASTGIRVPFWIVNAGGKYDFTAKWWNAARMQQVVDQFRGHILFVQIGKGDHAHPKLKGVIDLRGKTTLRELVLLTHHAQGVVCPVTLSMHLAAAVETRRGMPKLRPCVVIAGGREPPHWEAYPGHQFIHTVGSLPCCDRGGCWKSRVVPLSDGDDNDRSLCANVVRIDQFTGERIPEPAVPGEMFVARGGTVPLPRCMDMINADEVIRRIEMYFEGGVVKPLSRREAAQCAEKLPFLGWDSVFAVKVAGASLPSSANGLHGEAMAAPNGEHLRRNAVGGTSR